MPRKYKRSTNSQVRPVVVGLNQKVNTWLELADVFERNAQLADEFPKPPKRTPTAKAKRSARKDESMLRAA